ncbi:hypothetical protein Pint_14647 [Pistacia integerrima]|uniref:Uncharacterized protein n=1 Tax=Pistacia integerrima TaxID=434235 RepID=A0ACC0Y5C8_9ROSI|nr:hypothetical protein Pint_14647 [Pistacia integerrima]
MHGRFLIPMIFQLVPPALGLAITKDGCIVNLFTGGTNWINFDGVEAVKAKVSFAKEKGLLGYSVFQLGNHENWEFSSAAQKEGDDRQKQTAASDDYSGYISNIYAATGDLNVFFEKNITQAKGVI